MAKTRRRSGGKGRKRGGMGAILSVAVAESKLIDSTKHHCFQGDQAVGLNTEVKGMTIEEALNRANKILQDIVGTDNTLNTGLANILSNLSKEPQHDKANIKKIVEEEFNLQQGSSKLLKSAMFQNALVEYILSYIKENAGGNFVMFLNNRSKRQKLEDQIMYLMAKHCTSTEKGGFIDDNLINVDMLVEDTSEYDEIVNKAGEVSVYLQKIVRGFIARRRVAKMRDAAKQKEADEEGTDLRATATPSRPASAPASATATQSRPASAPASSVTPPASARPATAPAGGRRTKKRGKKHKKTKRPKRRKSSKRRRRTRRY